MILDALGEPADDDEAALKLFRNLAISRLVKKGDGNLDARSGLLSKLRASWKTRVQRSKTVSPPELATLWKTRVG